MPYATYDAFRTATLLMIDGDEVSSVISPATIDQMIALGESLIYAGDPTQGLAPLRASSMQVAMASVVGSGIVALPEDLLELGVVWFDSNKPLEVVPEEEVRRALEYSGGGDVRKCAQAGESLIFYPAATNGDVLGGRYYARPDPIKDGLHATFNRYPELYLYAALYSSAPFLGFDRRIPVWQSYYRAQLAAANSAEQMRVYGGSRLRGKAR